MSEACGLAEADEKKNGGFASIIVEATVEWISD